MNDDSQLIQNESTSNINIRLEPKFVTTKPIKIDNWTTANAKRVEENRKLSQQQIPSKSLTASAAFSKAFLQVQPNFLEKYFHLHKCLKMIHIFLQSSVQFLAQKKQNIKR